MCVYEILGRSLQLGLPREAAGWHQGGVGVRPQGTRVASWCYEYKDAPASTWRSAWGGGLMKMMILELHLMFLEAWLLQFLVLRRMDSAVSLLCSGSRYTVVNLLSTCWLPPPGNPRCNSHKFTGLSSLKFRLDSLGSPLTPFLAAPPPICLLFCLNSEIPVSVIPFGLNGIGDEPRVEKNNKEKIVKYF